MSIKATTGWLARLRFSSVSLAAILSGFPPFAANTESVAAGIQIGNTAISAYIVDCYPSHAMSVIVFYSVLLNLSAFVNPFFIAPWCDSVGFTWTFSAQGLLTFGVMMPVTVVLQRYGLQWRTARGEPRW